jgi:hypothetical protein
MAVIVVATQLNFSALNSANNPANNLTEYNSEVVDVKAKRIEIEQLILEYGQAEAYQKLKQQVSGESLGYQHDAAHIFGETLYRTVGLAGLPVCDNTLLNGCFHGFLLSAISRQGLPVIAQIDQYCDTDQDILFLACHHGVGHGLGEYLGPSQVNDQLEACLELDWRKPVGGCVGGVIMEYHFPSILDDDAQIIGVRRFGWSRPYDPCDQLSAKFKNSCAYYIPRWWKNFLSYQEIGQLCQGFATEQQWYCFHGAGYIAAHLTEFDVDGTKLLCAQMPSSQAELWCRLSAAWSFETSPAQKDRAVWPQLCQDLAGQEDFCLAEHDFDLVMPTLPDIEQQ